MTRKLLALAMIAALSACSSSNDGDSPATSSGLDGQSSEGSTDTNTPADDGTTPAVSNPSTTVAGEGGPPAGARAGAYIGDFGQGNGVYIIDNANNIVGLAQAADGSARSLFGNLGQGSSYTGGLNEYNHVASTPATEGVFSAGEGIASTDASTYNLNIVDGQTIEGGDVSLVAASAGALAPATTESLAGSWIGSHQFPLNESSAQLVTELTFSGSSFAGETRLENTDPFEGAIEGTLTPFGDVSLVSYTWLDNTYNGAVFFLPDGNGDIVFLGETANVEAGNRTIASRLTRQ